MPRQTTRSGVAAINRDHVDWCRAPITQQVMRWCPAPIICMLILLATLGGIGMFGASGLVIGPMLAALFLAVLTIYSQVFADALHHGGPVKNEQ